MIEKFKNYLFFDESKKNEEKEFSIIEVFPRLNFEETQEKEEEDKKTLFDNSLSDTCVLKINTRSQEAQQEIYSFLTAYGYDCWLSNNCNKNLPDCEKSESKIMREYYTISDKGIYKYLLTHSRLGIEVEVPISEISQFKKILHKLREKRNYRNVWKYNIDKVIIG